MIEVGELVRIKTGYIGIVENINDFRPPEAKICVDFNVPDLIFLGETDIIKHSKNIIDLIEVGDYVNGFKVYEYLGELVLSEPFTELREEVKDITINSILTKEQYEQNCYKIERE